MRKERRQLPGREHIFILSLMYHGYRLTYRRELLKWKKGYVVPSSKREDASGVDFFVKLPRAKELYPVQVTQRGVRMFKRRYRRHGKKTLDEFIRESQARIVQKREMCYGNGIAFVLVRDFVGLMTTPRLAHSDVRALRRALCRVRDRNI